ncbi:MAG: hypothetical protein ACREJG_04120, partial [Candidatus Rokuibacteriota bacterium]
MPAVETSPPPLSIAAGGGPRWYAHRFNRAGLYRMAAGLARALPRSLRLRAAGALADLLASRFPAERRV